MVSYKAVLVDSDVLIKAYRGNAVKQRNLELIKSKYLVSVITACELLNGAKNISQREEMNKSLRFYVIEHVTEAISKLAFSLYKKYSFLNKMQISDAFIAATAIHNNILLYTDNKKDFDFIKKIKFYKEK